MRELVSSNRAHFATAHILLLQLFLIDTTYPFLKPTMYLMRNSPLKNFVLSPDFSIYLSTELFLHQMPFMRSQNAESKKVVMGGKCVVKEKRN